MPLRIEQINYAGWQDSYRISNGAVEVVIPRDVGPRIMHYGFDGGQNLLAVFADQAGKSGEATWQARGGHRLWIAPEDPVKSYAPDNERVAIAVRGDVVESTGAVEKITGIEKHIAVKVSATGTGVEITHTLRNAGSEPYRLAPWALSMMAQGGVGIHGFPPRGTHPRDLAPVNPLVMWAFTNLTDPRWSLLEKYLCLRQDPANATPQKLGSYHRDTWGAYLLKGELFVKHYRAIAPPSSYPDFGCSFETFTNADFLELETLGPITSLGPGESLTHTERWSLHRGVTVERWTDAELDRVIAPVIAATNR